MHANGNEDCLVGVSTDSRAKGQIGKAEQRSLKTSLCQNVVNEDNNAGYGKGLFSCLF
jgi:hypothetical protein